MWVMEKNSDSSLDDSRPDIANIPSIDGMLRLYDKVLAELDRAISSQKDLTSSDNQASANVGTVENN